MERKIKIKFTDFECNLLINGMNEFRNMLLAEDLPTEDVDELLMKIIDKSEKYGGCYYVKRKFYQLPSCWGLPHLRIFKKTTIYAVYKIPRK